MNSKYYEILKIAILAALLLLMCCAHTLSASAGVNFTKPRIIDRVVKEVRETLRPMGCMCLTHSLLTKEVLRKLGYDAQLLAIYNPLHPGGMPEHFFVWSVQWGYIDPYPEGNGRYPLEYGVKWGGDYFTDLIIAQHQNLISSIYNKLIRGASVHAGYRTISLAHSNVQKESKLNTKKSAIMALLDSVGWLIFSNDSKKDAL